MTIEEINKILGVTPENVWKPDYDYDPGYVSDEENEELTKILESLTEDDLQTAEIRTIDRRTGELKKVVVFDV